MTTRKEKNSQLIRTRENWISFVKLQMTAELTLYTGLRRLLSVRCLHCISYIILTNAALHRSKSLFCRHSSICRFFLADVFCVLVHVWSEKLFGKKPARALFDHKQTLRQIKLTNCNKNIENINIQHHVRSTVGNVIAIIAHHWRPRYIFHCFWMQSEHSRGQMSLQTVLNYLYITAKLSYCYILLELFVFGPDNSFTVRRRPTTKRTIRSQ